MENFETKINYLTNAFEPQNIKFRSIGNGLGLYFSFTINGVNCKYELHQCETDPKDKKSLPNLWLKHGSTKKLISSYLTLRDYISLNNDLCISLPETNPTIKRSEDKARYEINFKFLKENTFQNVVFLIYLTFQKTFNFLNSEKAKKYIDSKF